MKKVLLILLLLCESLFAQVHESKIPTTRLSDSVLSNGKHEFTIQPDTSMRILGNLSVSKDIATSGYLRGNGSQIMNISQSNVTSLTTDLSNKQPLDADLTTISGLTATTDNFIVSVSSAWASRTPAQVKTTLSLNNVDNTSDATKNSATATLTNKTISGADNTITNLSRGYIHFNANLINPADNQTYYIGSFNYLSPTTTATQRRIYFPINCTIDSVYLSIYSATGGDTASSTFSILKNNTTNTVLSSSIKITATNNYVTYATYANVSITAGDYIEIKWIAGAWPTTNPGSVYVSGTLNIK